MKKRVLTFCFVFGISLLYAQLPTIGAYTIIPQNPAPGDFIKIATMVSTPNQGIIVDSNTHTVTGQQILIKGCYWQGMLTAVQYYVDTVIIGQLPVGNYQVTQIAYLSSTQQHCSKIDSNATSAPLQVSGLTGIKEEASDGFHMYPNPVSDKLMIPANIQGAEVFVFSATGNLMLRTGSGSRGDIDVSSLPEGIYFVRIHASNGSLTRRFIKAAAGAR